MSGRRLHQDGLGFGLAIALLAGCGGAAMSAAPQAPAAIRRALPHAQSWMLPEAGAQNKLIYATDGCGGTCVLSYPGGELVGTLDAGQFIGSGACTDKSGDVFISDNSSVVEYAHGGTSPIATFGLPGTEAKGCAIDPSTGNLAVVFVGSDTDVAVFATATGSPVLYKSGLNSVGCGYDTSGDLFVDGYNGQQAGLAELSNGSSQFRALGISNEVELPPGQVQWDGKYMTYESASKHPIVYRLRISGSTAKVVSETKFRGIKSFAYLSWIYRDRIFIPYSEHGPNAKKIGVWAYPSGEEPIAKFQHFTSESLRLQAVVLSVVRE